MQAEPRYAVSGDRRHYLTLAEEFVKEGTSPGMVWGPRTAGFFDQRFYEYVSDHYRRQWEAAGLRGGTVVICRDGFALAGGPAPYDTPWGNLAYGWATYVRPAARRQGLATRMRELVVTRLRELGYHAVAGASDPANEAALPSVARFHWQPLALTGVAILAPPERS